MCICVYIYMFFNLHTTCRTTSITNYLPLMLVLSTEVKEMEKIVQGHHKLNEVLRLSLTKKTRLKVRAKKLPKTHFDM